MSRRSQAPIGSGNTEIPEVGIGPWPVDAKIEMRLVHIFEMRDGKISRELVFDMASNTLHGLCG